MHTLLTAHAMDNESEMNARRVNYFYLHCAFPFHHIEYLNIHALFPFPLVLSLSFINFCVSNLFETLDCINEI